MVAYFQNDPLQDMVALGAVGPRSARLWMRSERPGVLRIHWWPESDPDAERQLVTEITKDNEQDNTHSLLIDAGLSPLTRYGYRIIHAGDGHILGRGGFETAPEKPEDTPYSFSIALMSCNQPFDENGRAMGKSLDMLRAARTCLKAHNAKMIFTVGDQMYADYPAALSLFHPPYFRTVAPPERKDIFECTVPEVRRLYHRRYRHFYNHTDWMAIHRDFPCYPILDDHDIIDNWGSAPAHRTPRWQGIDRGARLAYLDYQASRIMPDGIPLPEHFSYQLAYGHTAAFVLDIRSNRVSGEGGRLFSQEQREQFDRFLSDNADRRMLLIVLSVPIIHLPRFMARIAARVTASGEDFSDRWSSGPHIRDRDQFLKTLRAHQKAHPEQVIVLLSGDIHIGCIHQIHWNDEGPRLYQMVSSAITHIGGPLTQWASKMIIRINRRFETQDGELRGAIRLLKGVDGRAANPYNRLNLGIIEIKTPSARARPRARFLLYGHRETEPVCVFRSQSL